MKLSEIAAATEVDGTSEFVGLQTVAGLPAGKRYTVAQLAAYIGASIGDLDSVLTAGNTSDQDIILTDATATTTISGGVATISDGTTNKIEVSTYRVTGMNNAGTAKWFLGLGSGSAPTLSLLDNSGSGFFGNTKTGVLTAARTYTDADRSGVRQLSGDQVNPAYGLSANAGAGATLSFSATSDDRSGIVTLNTGTGCASGAQFTVTFNTPYSVATRVIIQGFGLTSVPQNARIYADGNTSTFIVYSLGFTDATTYRFTYIVQN
jgi:hypothetical protein